MVSTGTPMNAAASAKKKLAPPTNSGTPVHANASAVTLTHANQANTGTNTSAIAFAAQNPVLMLLQAFLNTGTNTHAHANAPTQAPPKLLPALPNSSTLLLASGYLFPNPAHQASTGASMTQNACS
jgi:hypothetical protein